MPRVLRGLNGALDRVVRCAGGLRHSMALGDTGQAQQADPGLHGHHLQTDFSPARRRRPRSRWDARSFKQLRNQRVRSPSSARDRHGGRRISVEQVINRWRTGVRSLCQPSALRARSTVLDFATRGALVYPAHLPVAGDARAYPLSSVVCVHLSAVPAVSATRSSAQAASLGWAEHAHRSRQPSRVRANISH
jgi:hypothetical protein